MCAIGAADGVAVARPPPEPLPALAVPHKRRGLPFPDLRRRREPDAGRGRAVWVLAFERAAFRMRWIGWARFSQLPPKGVYSGMMLCRHSHSTLSGVL